MSDIDFILVEILDLSPVTTSYKMSLARNPLLIAIVIGALIFVDCYTWVNRSAATRQTLAQYHGQIVIPMASRFSGSSYHRGRYLLLPSMKSVTITENDGTVQVSVEHDFFSAFIIVGFLVYFAFWLIRRRASSPPKNI